MRITVHIPDSLAEKAKAFAGSERSSVSSLMAQALEHFLLERRKKALGRKVLDLVGKGCVSNRALRQLHHDRSDDEYRS